MKHDIVKSDMESFKNNKRGKYAEIHIGIIKKKEPTTNYIFLTNDWSLRETTIHSLLTTLLARKVLM